MERLQEALDRLAFSSGRFGLFDLIDKDERSLSRG
jgi:hypothetical protein